MEKKLPPMLAFILDSAFRLLCSAFLTCDSSLLTSCRVETLPMSHPQSRHRKLLLQTYPL
jgi:hypothetical protein